MAIPENTPGEQQPTAAEIGKRTDTQDAVKAAHDQAEADIDADVELTDAAGPLEDLDEEEAFRQADDKTDLV